MTADSGAGWFERAGTGEDPAAVRDGQTDQPREWPALAVERGFAADESEYYGRLREATLAAARETTAEREGAGDQQLVHAVRALDDCARLLNELTERVAEWAGTRDPAAEVDIGYARDLAGQEPETPAEERVVSLATRVVDLDEERAQLRAYIERTAPEVAPNLAALAGPVLATRLVALSGGLESLAKQPSGTVQVLGAEEALFAHLRGGADPPKHGVIYTHEAVRGTAREHRGSAARALAGKLTIAARIDHYSGERNPELAAELEERIERIRARDVS
jgi:Protein implicated in ribosomal biogenesis, Nop56p homolog